MSTESRSNEIAESGEPENRPPKKWRIPQEAIDLAWKVNMEILQDENQGARNKMAASAQIKSMIDSNIKISELNDKIDRLDSGRPTEISDPGTLGTAVGDLANRLSGILGNRPENDTRVVEVSDGSEAEIQGLPNRAEHSDPDGEAT